MRLLDVYTHRGAADLLYQLLSEREPHQNISHRAMPSMEEHLAFIASRPYAAWYIVEAVTDCVDDVALITEDVGAVYLTHAREIGVGILKRWRRQGYAAHAVRALMKRHPGRFLANINPTNEPSIALFHKLGFGPQPIQHTYERPA